MFNRSVSFLVAAAAGAATLTAASAPSPLYPVYERLWDFSPFVLTVIFAAYVVALLLALLTVGSLSDTVGRRPVTVAALVLLAVGMVVFSVADGVGGLLAARIIQGIAVGAASGTITAMILDAAPTPKTGGIVSSAVSPLGIVVGAVLAGALVEFAPLPRQLVFWTLAALDLLIAALVCFIPEQTSRERRSWGAVARSLRPSAGLPEAARPVFFSLIPSLVATWALAGLHLSLGSSVLGTVFDLRSHFAVGMILGVFFAAGAIGTVVSAELPAPVQEWFGHAALASGVLVTILGLSTTALPLYVIGSAVAGLGFGSAIRFAVNALGEASPTAHRGQVFATMYVLSYIAFSIPALVAGLAVEPFGLEQTAAVYGAADIALVLIAAALGLARVRRRAGAAPGLARPVGGVRRGGMTTRTRPARPSRPRAEP